MIDQPTIDRILDAAQIVDVVSEFVTLRKRGVNFVGLCPFHDDKTPSFYVSPAKGLCKCFACGKGGNAVHFVMEHEQMTYPEALRWLAKKYNIEIKERELTDEEKQVQNIRESLFVVNEFARDYFQNILYNHADGKAIAMSYFRQRGIRDDIVKKFQLGYSTTAPDALAQEAMRKGYKKEFLLKTGLCYEKEDGSLRDRFWGRVIFPWFNISGKVLGFGGRVLDSRTKGVNQKYVNSPESEIFSKRKELYGIYQAKAAIVKADCVYMVEGYTDVIAMHQCGLENVVANSGTALSEQQIRLLHRFTSNITLLYDGDEAGIKASIRGIDMLLAEGMNIKVLLLPDGDDPDSFSRKHNATEFRKYIDDHEENFIRFKTNLLLKDAQRDPIKRAGLISDMARSIGLIPDKVIRYTCLTECATLLNVNEQIILDEIKKHLLQRDDNYLEQIKKEKDASATTGSLPPADTPFPAGSIPPADMPTLGVDDNVPPPFPPAEAEAGYQSYIPQEGREKYVFYVKEQLLLQTLIRHGEKVMCYVETEENTNTTDSLENNDEDSCLIDDLVITNSGVFAIKTLTYPYTDFTKNKYSNEIAFDNEDLNDDTILDNNVLNKIYDECTNCYNILQDILSSDIPITNIIALPQKSLVIKQNEVLDTPIVTAEDLPYFIKNKINKVQSVWLLSSLMNLLFRFDS